MHLLILMFMLPLINIFWGGYVGSVLWYWFITPLGAPQITYLHFVGLATVVNLFLGSRGHDPDRMERKSSGDIWAEGLGIAIVYPAISLFMGWIIHSLM